MAYRDLIDDDLIAKLIHQGFGYELLANIANNALEKLDNILNIMENVKSPDNIKKYFSLSYDENKSLPLATSNGPFGTMIIVQSDYDYPFAARAIKDLFRPNPQAATSPVAFRPRNVMLQLPGKIDKESEAKKGIIKFMLLHICGDIDINQR
jgi:hypothetical protein